MKLEEVLTQVLRLDVDDTSKARLATLISDHPQWKDEITECWEMHQELTLCKRGNRSGLPSDCGPYEILDEIDRGGMGIVYRARHKELNRIVALKIIRAGELADKIEIARFRREAMVAANLTHPGIVTVYEVVEKEQFIYYTMRYIEGVPLSDFGKDPSLPIQAKVRIIHLLTESLDYAHRQGVAHRDIKPRNILIDIQGNPILIDFGLAKLTQTDSDLTDIGATVGTPAYMAPEQIQFHRMTDLRRSDIYSLGAVMYYLLVGRAPFVGATNFDMMLQVKDREPVRPSRINRSIDSELDIICMRAMEKSPEDRYPSAADFGEDLKRWMEGSAIMTPTTSLWIRWIRWWRQEPGLFLHVVAISTVTLVVLLSHLVGYSESDLRMQLLLLIAWLAICFPLQRWIFCWKNPFIPAVIWGLVDITLVTTLIANAQAPRSLLLAAYPLMVTVSGLFYRTRFVLLMTMACTLAFLVLTTTLDDPSMARTDFRFIFVSVLAVQCLTLTSLISKVRNLFSYRNQ
jgi:hypothetical protein